MSYVCVVQGKVWTKLFSLLQGGRCASLWALAIVTLINLTVLLTPFGRDNSLNLWFIVRHLCLLSDSLLGNSQGMITLVSKKGEGDQDRKTLGQFVLQRKESD